MKPRLLVVLVSLLALAALAGCGSSSSSSGGSTGADPAKLVPAQAPIYIGATVRPDGQLGDDATAALKKLLQTDDPSLRRIFPPAYVDDAAANDEYRRLMREELLEGKLEALRVFEETAGADRLSEEQLEAWLGALESLRLFLGTQLDVQEEIYSRPIDPDDPDAPSLALYGYLSFLQEQVVEALSASL